MIIRRKTSDLDMVFSSEDFLAGELFTHGQSCIWLVGHSDLAQALLQDVDPHSQLAAMVLNVSYEEFIRRKKEPRFKAARQAAKPVTFGKPGGAGSPTIVMQQRKQGPATPCPGGPSLVDDGDGNLVEGFNGLRFCILMNGAKACGIRKTTFIKKRGRDERIPPTCVECLECAEQISNVWKRQWRENVKYFDFISDCVDCGMRITREMLDRWPHLYEVFEPGQRLAPGEIMQHVSGRVRRIERFTEAANGFFQGLLADITKAAARRASRECYDSTYRIPDDITYWNSKRSSYVGGVSPLYGSRLIGFFHDELFFEHPRSVAPEAADRVSEIMVEEMAVYCPDVAAKAKAEPTLMERWDKRASYLTHDGRLAVWTPEHNSKTCPECLADLAAKRAA